MAKNQSIVRLSGSIDGVTYTDGKYGKESRSRTSLTKAKMDANPNFRVLRLVQRELTGYSKYGGLLRTGIRGEVRRIMGTRDVQRLNRQFILVKNSDIVNRLGERNVPTGLKTAVGKNYLNHFDFYGSTTVGAVVQRPFAIDMSSGEARIVGFNPMLDLVAPMGCTHVGFKSVMIGLDFDLMAESTTRSEMVTMPLDGPVVDLILQVDGLPVVSTNLFYLIQVLFYKEFGGLLELTELDYAAFTVMKIEA